MVMCKKKTIISICVRTLVLVLAVIITYCIGMKNDGWYDLYSNVICEIKFDDNVLVISYEKEDEKVNYYAKYIYSSLYDNIEIDCYDNITCIDEKCQETKIFTSNDFLKTFEFDVVYDGIRRHYSVSDLKNNN